jgi:hypothetical protein
MNNNDAIVFLAQSNGKHFHPLREDELEDVHTPFFQVYKGANNAYEVNMFNFDKHDNAPRMPFYCEYLMRNVFPNVDLKYDLSGYYPIELHDSYSYLSKRKTASYDNVLTFAKHQEDAYPVLIPDPFAIGNYGGRLNEKDPLKWNDKSDKVGFFGVTTGNTNPVKNERLKICDWSRKHRDMSEFYITRIAQIEPRQVLNAYPEFKDMYHDPVKQHEQYKYKFLLSADGNTCSYDRMCWIMKSNSMLFKYQSNDILWYYPLVMEGTHFTSVTTDNIVKKREFYLNNPNQAQLQIANANHFVQNFVTPVNTMMYATYLFENLAENKA